MTKTLENPRVLELFESLQQKHPPHAKMVAFIFIEAGFYRLKIKVSTEQNLVSALAFTSYSEASDAAEEFNLLSGASPVDVATTELNYSSKTLH